MTLRTVLCILFVLLGFDRSASSAPLPASPTPAEPIQVVATFPVLKDLVEQIGRERVKVTSLLTGLESEHTYTPKPTDILAIHDARMLVQIGLGLEVWVDALIKNADNRRLLIVTTSTGIALIKNQGDRDTSHSLGDPHIWLDPENAKLMARQITEGLMKIDPAYKKYYMHNQAAYFKELDQTLRLLLLKLKPIRNKKIITHHAAWPYFARRFGLNIRGVIVSQIGTEPSAKHLAELIQTVRREQIRVIVSEPQLNPKLPQILAQETGAQVVVLTPIPGAIAGAETYRSMIEYDVDQLVDALKD